MSSFSNRFNSKKIVFAILILFSCLSFAQDNDAKVKEIKALSEKSYKSYFEFRNEESLEYSEKANKIALEMGESSWIATTYNQLARAYTNMGKQKEALVYIDKAMAEEYTSTNVLLQAKLIILKANNHSILVMKDLADKENFEALDLLKHENTDPKILTERVIILNLVSTNAFGCKDYLSALKYENSKIGILKKLPKEFIQNHFYQMYNKKGYIFLETKKLDSSLYYFNKGFNLKKKNNDPLLFEEYRGLGDYYERTGDYKNALDYYLKTVENLKKVDIEDPAFTEVNKSISEIYAKMGEKEKESAYLKKYTEKNNTLQQTTKEGTDEAVKMILKENEKKIDTVHNNSFLIISAIVAGVLVLISGLFVWYKKSSKKKEKIISETQELLAEKEEIIGQKEEETQELKQKVNESFEEIVQLAKENSPEFLTRFQEVYPEFIKYLLTINPNLIASELRFSAMLFLNFSTKDIAEYTFVTTKTVQNRKNNIRKKLNISSEEDLYVWFKNVN